VKMLLNARFHSLAEKLGKISIFCWSFGATAFIAYSLNQNQCIIHRFAVLYL